MTWTIEPHGDGYALYENRDDMRHGMNLVYMSEPDANWPRVKALIEAAPDMLSELKEARDALASLKEIPVNREFLNYHIHQIDKVLAKARGEK